MDVIPWLIPSCSLHKVFTFQPCNLYHSMWTMCITMCKSLGFFMVYESRNKNIVHEAKRSHTWKMAYKRRHPIQKNQYLLELKMNDQPFTVLNSLRPNFTLALGLGRGGGGGLLACLLVSQLFRTYLLFWHFNMYEINSCGQTWILPNETYTWTTNRDWGRIQVWHIISLMTTP